MSRGQVSAAVAMTAGTDAASDVNRPDRPAAMAFVLDAASESALRDGFADALIEPMEIRRGGLRAAIAVQQKAVTPRLLIVDIAGEDEPLMALTQLSEVVEPDTCVLVIGDSSDLTLYREITRGLGVAEYLAKPLTRDLVAQHFVPMAAGQTAAAKRGGRFVTITGARGGVGASVVAANLAWHLGMTLRRHTVLLDADLYLGTAALMLDIEPSPGLRAALEAPERIDTLLAERAAVPVSPRLHVLAAQEKLVQEIAYASGAAAQLLEALARRYNFIVGDVRWQPHAFGRELLAASGHRVIVLTPTLSSVRDALRLMPGSAGQQRATLVLNRLGMPGGLKRQQVEDALKTQVDVTIPDLPRQIGQAITMGQPASAQSSAFRSAIEELSNQLGATASQTSSGLKSRFGGLRQLLGKPR